MEESRLLVKLGEFYRQLKLRKGEYSSCFASSSVVDRSKKNSPK